MCSLQRRVIRKILVSCLGYVILSFYTKFNKPYFTVVSVADVGVFLTRLKKHNTSYNVDQGKYLARIQRNVNMKFNDIFITM